FPTRRSSDLYRITQTCDQAIDLTARQLPAFAGLRPLGDLDLQHFSIHQISWSHTETTRSHLLDFGALQGAVARRVFTTLATVGASAQAVHGFSQRFMGLR